MKHTIIGFTRREKSTIYYLTCDDDKRPSSEGLTCCHVFVPVSRHTPNTDDIGKNVELRLRKVGDEWLSSITFDN